MRGIADWLDDRTGWRAALHALLDEPVPGGARWSYVFGSTLVFALVVQAVTGVVLAAHYAPSVQTAWASVAYIQDGLSGGWVVRGLHAAGASAMILLLGLHLLQVAIWGAYKKPREMTWIVGVVLLALVLAFALTGYLLPWDQKGYWATQVATSLMGATPLVGHALQALVQGGASYGNLTLTHFYALHVLVLPALVFALVALHLAFMRRHGVTPAWDLGPHDLRTREETFWPGQLARDMVAVALVCAALLAMTLSSHGADLEAPADPTSAYDARPEWYFLPLFQLLKLFPGRLEVTAALGAPLIVFGSLLLLPFLDRSPERAPRRRWPFVAWVLVLGLGAVGLGAAAKWQDRHSALYAKQRERARLDAARARGLAMQGVPPAGGTAVYDNDPDNRARAIFGQRCGGCHALAGAGAPDKPKAPALDGWASRKYIEGVLRDPDARFAASGVSGMKPVHASDDDIRALVEFVYSLGGDPVDAALADKGKALFADKDCDDCHETDGTTPGVGAPNLGGWGAAAWVAAFVAEPDAPRFYGAKKNKMPRFAGKLSDTELGALGQLLRGERTRAR